MKNKSYIALFFIFILIASVSCLVIEKRYFFLGGFRQQPVSKNQQDNGDNEAPVVVEQNPSVVDQGVQGSIQTVDPIPNALSRITKKPFGIYVTPKNSPVQPERFQGYHAGSDLEITADEQNNDVSVVTLCNGVLLVKRFASGYGGVAVQKCLLDGQNVTIVYGHLRLESIVKKIGDELRAGEFLGYLGTGFSRETDGERKHLHLAIRKGNNVNILGYAQSKAELSGWLDSAKYLN